MTLRATIRRALGAALADLGTLRAADSERCRKASERIAEEVGRYLDPPGEGPERYDDDPSHGGLLVTRD